MPVTHQFFFGKWLVGLSGDKTEIVYFVPLTRISEFQHAYVAVIVGMRIKDTVPDVVCCSVLSMGLAPVRFPQGAELPLDY